IPRGGLPIGPPPAPRPPPSPCRTRGSLSPWAPPWLTPSFTPPSGAARTVSAARNATRCASSPPASPPWASAPWCGVSSPAFTWASRGWRWPSCCWKPDCANCPPNFVTWPCWWGSSGCHTSPVSISPAASPWSPRLSPTPSPCAPARKRAAACSMLLPSRAVSPAWALAALSLAEFDRRSLRAQALLVSAVVATRCLAIDLATARPILAIAPTIVCFWAAMLRRQLGSLPRMFDSLLATLLLGALIFHEVPGSVLTVAWCVEAVALLAAGFALRDRVLRLSRLALFLICALKLFFWDLRNLETLPRIVSFILLRLLLVAVSWVYTRFRDQVQRFL